MCPQLGGQSDAGRPKTARRQRRASELNDETTGTPTGGSGQPGGQQPQIEGPGAAPPPPGAQTSQQEIDEAKVVAAIGYLSILCIIPLITPPGNKFAKFHGRQGLVLLIAEIALGVVLTILGFILGLAGPFGWLLMHLISGVVGLGFLVLAIVGIVKAANGEYWKMPVLGDFAEKLNI
jgi:uncharacterized membrane protein